LSADLVNTLPQSLSNLKLYLQHLAEKCVNGNAMGAGGVYLSLPWIDEKVKLYLQQFAITIKEFG
jgi:hypothetical protein